ncbi:MAG: translation elongation factor Ts [Oscillospiraceae bacterium]|jgi:elongation factor Ts
MEIKAKDVMALREATGCGMMDCKKALVDANGDMDKAIEILREKGLAKAEKKAGRIAAEGLAYAEVKGNAGAVVEVNSETDFVAKNEIFQNFVHKVTDVIIDKAPADLGALAGCEMDGTTVEETRKALVGKIGENIQIRRFTRYEGIPCAYVHGGGTHAVLVNFALDPDKSSDPKFQEAAKDVCMQIAALYPQYVDRTQVPEAEVAHEKEILTQQAINEGKPAEIAAKVVNGRINKFYKEVCLLDQDYVKDGDMTVGKYLDQVGREIGAKITVKEFVRYERGEGIEKREDNLADEVAKLTGKK